MPISDGTAPSLKDNLAQYSYEPSTTGKDSQQRPLIGIRKTAARRVQEAWQTIPHIVQMVE